MLKKRIEIFSQHQVQFLFCRTDIDYKRNRNVRLPLTALILEAWSCGESTFCLTLESSLFQTRAGNRLMNLQTDNLFLHDAQIRYKSFRDLSLPYFKNAAMKY